MTGKPNDPLAFDSDKGSWRSKLIAGVLVLVLIGWMGSGFIIPSETATTDEGDTDAAPAAIVVSVQRSTAQSVTQFFVAEGQAQPDRATDIRPEMSGAIAEVLVNKGDEVKAGEVVARFDTSRATTDMTRAEEELSRAQREFDNAETLLARGAGTADRVSTARATLAAAQAQVSEASETLTNTEIRVPFDGRLETLTLDAGEYVQQGAEVARVVDNTPLTISVRVPQQALRSLKVGQIADTKFITGEVRQGAIAFLGSNADSETRTFLAEITVENADGAIPAGVSAEVRVPTGEITAHFVSPAILSLDTDGTLGVKSVDGDNKVVFQAVQIERAQTDGIWVSGLPDQVDIITIGQGFVNDGETVSPQLGDQASLTTLTAATRRVAGLSE